LTTASATPSIHTITYGKLESGRIPNWRQEAGPWRIAEIVPDFILEDVWALPVEGGAEDFPALLEMMASIDPAQSESTATRALWELRDRLGAWFELGRVDASQDGGGDPPVGKLPIPGAGERSLAERLPEDLRGTAAEPGFDLKLFAPLYRTEVEAAAEISNQTVHGVAHLGWVERGEGRYQGQMAVYVKPRGLFGRSYMALIKPFRHLVVYPALMRQFESAWKRRAEAAKT
jgi:Protein of unknown function (DUF2867)